MPVTGVSRCGKKHRGLGAAKTTRGADLAVVGLESAALTASAVREICEMHVRFWGTRGSIAKPGPRTTRYGGNTSCVELRSAAGTLIVIDCGTGAHELGKKLVETEGTPVHAVLLSRTGCAAQRVSKYQRQRTALYRTLGVRLISMPRYLSPAASAERLARSRQFLARRGVMSLSKSELHRSGAS